VANRNVVLYNPTGADITVNAQTVPAHGVVKKVISDATTDLYAFVAAGCHCGPSVAERPKIVDEIEEAGFYLQRNAEDIGRL
jgi:hypothetical protein